MKFIQKKLKPTGPKQSFGKKLGLKLGNRTLIGVLCIVIALGVCFGVAPLVNGAKEAQAQIPRIKQTVVKGSRLTENDVEMVTVGAYNLPQDVYTKKEDVVGQYATGDLYPGAYLLSGNLTRDVGSASDILESLGGEQKALSLTIGSFAQGLSGKLETGDIVSVIVYFAKEGIAETPEELQYLKVITSTTSGGVDKADVTDKSQPVTVTLLVNQKQAELLAMYERTAAMHFALEYRGDVETAQRYLDMQEQYFLQKGEEE